MSRERWDVVLKVLSGPQSSQGAQTFRGPIVRVGSNPGAGGLKLTTGYRGLDARHCVISAYDGSSIKVSPVGTNQVRLAPHPHVKWKEIDPISSPQYLSEGAAIHLGPVGRGATIEFVKAQRLGVWTEGQLRSDAEAIEAEEISIPVATQAVPKRSRIRVLSATAVPIWFMGCLFLMSSTTVVIIAVLVVIQGRTIKPLGPKDDGQEFYEYVVVNAENPVHPALKEGLRQGFHDFVAHPNAVAANEPRLDNPDVWDTRFYDHTAASLDQHLSAWTVFRRLDEIREEYKYVVVALREAGLPEVMAAMPYIESRYRPDAQSQACAKGYWQFMPELANRYSDFTVRDCGFVDAPDLLWNTEFRAPPPASQRDYLSPDGGCRITGCAVDDRTDLYKSTDAAVRSLLETWQDPVIQASGAATEITILSHNAGYDDSRFLGRTRKTNLLPAYKSWRDEHEEDVRNRFYGENILCEDPHGGGATGADRRCGSVLMPETQHYGYPVVAVHLLAVCYYAQSYDDEEFDPWREYTLQEGYCRDLNVPLAESVRRQKPR